MSGGVKNGQKKENMEYSITELLREKESLKIPVCTDCFMTDEYLCFHENREWILEATRPMMISIIIFRGEDAVVEILDANDIDYDNS